MFFKRIFNSIRVAIKDDWGLLLVALGVASIVWWNITQRSVTERWFWSVEVSLENGLKPSLVLHPDQVKRPKVAIKVRGPRSYMDTLSDSSFQMSPDLSSIQSATKQSILLSPDDLRPQPRLVQTIPMDRIRIVSSEDIKPLRIDVQTIWNSKIRPIVPKIGKPAPGYIVSASKVTPATLTLAGSDPELEAHPFIQNRIPLRLQSVRSKTFTHEWKLEDFALGELEVLNMKPNDTIRLDLQIESQFASQEFRQVPVDVLNATEVLTDFTYTPRTVDVFLQGARASIQSMTAESIKLGFEIPSSASEEFKIPWQFLTGVNIPSNVNIVQVTPAEIHVERLVLGPVLPTDWLLTPIPTEVPPTVRELQSQEPPASNSEQTAPNEAPGTSLGE
ncbi:MAG: hypothetical protein H6751_16280 [Candidatus Omnitrophica bacterium]|nr:hypothetical protein [Candidatus Omnitrophota bacterium]MCB9784523.1 hypothetical protein [Candidatus Omnitrophota bacterium]